MIPFIIFMLLVPAVALALIAVLDHRFSKIISVVSTLAVLIMVLEVLAVSFISSGSARFVESYPYISSLPISLNLSINFTSLVLLIMSSVVLLATALSGNVENERPKLSSALVVLFQMASVGLFTTTNLFMFFIFWDVGVVAMFFMINVLGSANRKYASMNFLVYEAFASAMLLLGIILIYFYTPLHSFDIPYIVSNARLIPTPVQELIFLVLFLAFMTNMPIFPMHLWLPDAHTEAPTQGSMLLSGILTKFGCFGMLLLFYTLPVAQNYAAYIALLAIVSTFYSLFVLMKQTDIKRVIAYSTIVEMGIILLGISSITVIGAYGSIYAMLAHGLGVALMFLVAGSMQYVFGERDIRILRGTVFEARLMTYAFLIGTIAIVGFPLTSGFIADILMFMGSIGAFGFLGAVSLLAIALLGAYLYFIINRSMLSTKVHSEAVNFIGVWQYAGCLLLIFFIFLFGMLPFIILNLANL